MEIAGLITVTAAVAVAIAVSALSAIAVLVKLKEPAVWVQVYWLNEPIPIEPIALPFRVVRLQSAAFASVTSTPVKAD